LPNGRMFATLGSNPSRLYEISNYSSTTTNASASYLTTLPQNCFGIAYLNGQLEITGFASEDLPEACLKMGFEIVVLSAEDSSTYHKLKAVYHKDPFDRMLIWQAIRNNYSMISVDRNVKKYVLEGLKIWEEK